MAYQKDETNRTYLEDQIYSKKLELKCSEAEHVTYLAVHSAKCQMLRDSIDSMVEQIKIDDKNKADIMEKLKDKSGSQVEYDTFKDGGYAK